MKNNYILILVGRVEFLGGACLPPHQLGGLGRIVSSSSESGAKPRSLLIFVF